jgi:NAD(P)-dependent dehydrogenase (short-subunit alcohol dehydrogenase family)
MILITGASRGIGKYLFDIFHETGELVYGTYYNTKPAPAYLSNFSRVDISDYYDVENWIKSIRDKDKLNNIVLINCAGSNYNSFAHKSDPESWYNVIKTNLLGTYNVIRLVLPLMREDNYGRIINFSSVVAQIGAPGASAYAASKAGLWGLSKCLAVENARKGITINSLNLGYFDSGMINEVPVEYQNILKSRIPTGRFGESKNIYNAVLFLIQSDYVNGTSIDINGGLI